MKRILLSIALVGVMAGCAPSDGEPSSTNAADGVSTTPPVSSESVEDAISQIGTPVDLGGTPPAEPSGDLSPLPTSDIDPSLMTENGLRVAIVSMIESMLTPEELACLAEDLNVERAVLSLYSFPIVQRCGMSVERWGELQIASIAVNGSPVLLSECIQREFAATNMTLEAAMRDDGFNLIYQGCMLEVFGDGTSPGTLGEVTSPES